MNKDVKKEHGESVEPLVYCQHTIFGEVDEVVQQPTRVTTPKTEQVRLDRRVVFGGIKKKSKRAEGETQPIDTVLADIEEVLSLKPYIRKNKWCTDDKGNPKYRILAKPRYYGENPMGLLNAYQRRAVVSAVLNIAREAISKQYLDGSDNFVAHHAMELLVLRVRYAEPEEDIRSLLIAFLEVATQCDFIDNTRVGDTIRSITRREQMRLLRAQRKVNDAQLRGETLSIEQAMSEAHYRVKRYDAASCVPEPDNEAITDSPFNDEESDDGFAITPACSLWDSVVEQRAYSGKDAATDSDRYFDEDVLLDSDYDDQLEWGEW